MIYLRRFYWHVLLIGVALALWVGGPALAHRAAESTGSSLAQTDSAQNWLHYGYDSAYTGYNPQETTINVENVAQLEQKWGVDCDQYASDVSRSPAIYNGTLYTSGDGLSAYDARTGAGLWQFDDGRVDWAPPPVVSDDGIVFYLEGNNPSYLYAIDAEHGEQLWKSPLGFELGFNDTAVVTVDEANQLVYLLEAPFSDGGVLYALDQATGEVIWFLPETADGFVFRGDYVLLSDGKIYAKVVLWGENDRMVRLDAASQALELTIDRPGGIEQREICYYSLCADKLAVTYCEPHIEDMGSALAIFDANNGTVLWQQSYPAGITGALACNPDQNRLYVPTEAFLYALDATTGGEVWTYAGFSAIYSPSLANGVVYFISDTNMYALDEATGEQVFRFPLGGNTTYTSGTQQVAISHGMVFFSGTSSSCDLFALGLPE